MILVDTSVWIDYLRSNDEQFRSLLLSQQIVMHPFVITEIALRSIQNRNQFLKFLSDLPQVKIARQEEVNYLIEKEKFFALGIGFVDIHLVASCLLSGVKLWTTDKRLLQVATIQNIAMLSNQ